MALINDLWETFKDSTLWEKILLFIPFILMFAFAAVLYIKDSKLPNKSIVKHSKDKTDQVVKEFEARRKESKKIREEIKEARGKIQDEIDESRKEYGNTIDRIDNADPDKLSRIAAELRADAATRRITTRSRSSRRTRDNLSE